MGEKKEERYPIGTYKKSNSLIAAKYRSSLMANQAVAIAMASLQHANINANGDLVCCISSTEMKKLLHAEANTNVYKQLNLAAQQITGAQVGISNPDTREFEYHAVITDSSFKNGVFEVVFNKKLKEQLLDLQKRYTTLSLGVMLGFKSVYSLRLYELLRSQEYNASRVRQENLLCREIPFRISELRFELGLVDASEKQVQAVLTSKSNPDFDLAEKRAVKKIYCDWREMKRHVVEPAVKEINETTELVVRYEPQRAGRGGKIVGVTFYVAHKTENDEGEESRWEEVSEEKGRAYTDQDILSVVEMISTDPPISRNEAELLLHEADGNIERIQAAYDVSKTAGHIDNFIGWMISAIRNGYAKPVNKGTKNMFNDFQQNHYNFDDLEDQLLKN